MNIKRKHIVIGVLSVIVVIFVAVLVRPAPVPVEYATAEYGRLQATVDEEGVTRVRDRFLVASPILGRLRRIELDEGDSISRGEVVGQVSPLPLDVRTEAQARARLEGVQALEREAQAAVEAAAASFEEALRQQARAESLAVKGLIATEQVELARLAAETAQKALESARFRSDAAGHEVEVAQAALVASAAGGPVPPAHECVEIRAPIDGTVLRVYEESERVVPAGTPLIALGDPAELEIVVDLLSTDAVRVRAGAEMLIEEWGGDEPLRAVVRVVEPSGFTKVSALGVEEQRVNVIADFVDPPASLGDGYRVETRTIVWESDSTLVIPWSALVRRGEGWGVYVIGDGRASWRDIEAGHRGALSAEILSGLEAGEAVILHPSDRVEDRVRVSSSPRGPIP